MKEFRFHLSLYIVIPVIFAGMSVLSGIVAFQVTESYLRTRQDLAWPLAIWLGCLAVFAFGVGLLVVRLLLKPARDLIDRAQSLPILAETRTEADKGRKTDELEHYTRVFEQISNVLSKVDVRQMFPEVIGESRALRGVLSQVRKIAPLDATVLIYGESGTGKELIASSIYSHSARRDKPFVKLNCAAIPEGLLESELFGHEKGAFTGAASARPGKFEQAEGGTLFLDEIGDMPSATQAKILRALQEKEVERVGGSKPVKVNVRFIAATNRNLKKLVETGAFREDLYYRLSVLTIFLPPLRERTEDIPLLANHFLEKHPRDLKISTSALNKLMAYAWPGNVRELQNMIEKASVLCDGEVIEPAHIPVSIADVDNLARLMEADGRSEGFSLDQHLKVIETEFIEDALRRAGGVQVRAADILGINQRSLWHRVKKYDIDVNRFKTSTD